MFDETANNGKDEIEIRTQSSEEETVTREKFFQYFQNCPIPEKEILHHLNLFMNRQTLSRVIFMHEMYQKIINVHGVVMEFGVRWGRDLALFESFRGMYEPYNYSRKIIGFDTFEGFPSIHQKDGQAAIASTGAYSVTSNYEDYLEKILEYHEHESPLSHIKKYELVKGDASLTVKKYLEENPETIISFAYFDLDLYEPTRNCLEAIKGHLTKGSVIGFDELNVHDFPGETLAVKEILGLSKYQITRSPINPHPSYIIID